jgi:hypothetical protein
MGPTGDFCNVRVKEALVVGVADRVVEFWLLQAAKVSPRTTRATGRRRVAGRRLTPVTTQG